MPLAPCPHCDRHVEVAESACPFCSSPLSGLSARAVAPRSLRRLGRAAVLFAGSLGVAACGSTDEPPVEEATEETYTSGDELEEDGYDDGAADPIETDEGNTGRPSDDDYGNVVAMYGVPSPD